MDTFEGRIAVVTGGGSGMGRGLVRQLSEAGCHVAMCDVSEDTMAETKALCASGVKVTSHRCDVSDQRQVIAFADAVGQQHATDHVDLLFNNAGIGGGASFVAGDRAEWDRTFAIVWGGVYNCTRAFLPMLLASRDAVIVNTSSVNGFWACLGPNSANTAYSSAKFAVKGFSESLLVDLRLHAPHVKVAVVMPGHIGTNIVINTSRVLGRPDPLQMTDAEVAAARDDLGATGLPVSNMTDDDIRQAIHAVGEGFRNSAPITGDQAATIILDGVKTGQWRILVGEDAKMLDKRVREAPERAYDQSFGGILAQ